MQKNTLIYTIYGLLLTLYCARISPIERQLSSGERQNTGDVSYIKTLVRAWKIDVLQVTNVRFIQFEGFKHNLRELCFDE